MVVLSPVRTGIVLKVVILDFLVDLSPVRTGIVLKIQEIQVAAIAFPRICGATTLKRPVYHTLGVCFFKASLPVDRSDVEGTICCYRESPSRYFICEVFLRATHERLVPP